MNVRFGRQGMDQVTFTVPAASGSYAPERLTFGEVVSGAGKMVVQRLTVQISTSVATNVVEVWLPKVTATAPYLDQDYAIYQALSAATGGQTYELAGYPGCQVRVKSGGTGGNTVISASVI